MRWWVLLLVLLSGPVVAVPVTFAWDLNPAHDDPAITWRIDVSGQMLTCIPVVVQQERRCTIDLVNGPKTVRIRAELGEVLSDWSNTIAFDVNPPGVYVVISHQEMQSPSTPVIEHRRHGVSTQPSFSVSPVSISVGRFLYLAIAVASPGVEMGPVTVSMPGVTWTQLMTTPYAIRRRLTIWRGASAGQVMGVLSVNAAGSQEALWSLEEANAENGVPIVFTSNTATSAVLGSGYCAVAVETTSFQFNQTQLASLVGENVRSLKVGYGDLNCSATWTAGNGAGGASFIFWAN